MQSNNITPLQQQYHNQEPQARLTTGRSSSSSTTKEGTASQPLTDREQEIVELCQVYREDFGVVCPAPVRRRFALFLRTIEKDMLIEVMDEAAMAPMPSWRYANAIIDACIAEDCLTAEDFRLRRIRHKCPKW